MTTKTKAAPTPGPWTYDVFDKVYILGPEMKSKSGERLPVYIADMVDSDDEGLCAPFETVKANARHLVRAVNHHEELADIVAELAQEDHGPERRQYCSAESWAGPDHSTLCLVGRAVRAIKKMEASK